jgi:hypothetical protein
MTFVTHTLSVDLLPSESAQMLPSSYRWNLIPMCDNTAELQLVQSCIVKKLFHNNRIDDIVRGFAFIDLDGPVEDILNTMQNLMDQNL